ncbi:prolipoprotein diacylglyceryl transferase [Calothrix sp. NIES-4071]|nr:prolipoprotein diacylglyceryl transferase [Calothrix sp. NIES-4071]BAZ58001.1 prolipoprotein diacylglyceryl transferase [Calothrix sp. NIES-4105]
MKILVYPALSCYLGSFIRPTILLGSFSLPAFQVFGYIGLLVAITLAFSLATYQSLAFSIVGTIILAAVCTFFILVILIKIFTGKEQLVYYHHSTTVLIVTTALLWRLNQPILPYLDTTILGIGIFLACGRIGCLMVGCCHGRPYRWGIRYQTEHVAAGFTPYYVGVRLFPIQAIESLWVLCIVLVGCYFVLNNYLLGTALAWYVITYGLGRFHFEFLRGDPERYYFWGFSEAQWTSLILIFAVVLAENFGCLPLQQWHLGVFAYVGIAMITVTFKRRLQKMVRYELLHPHHVKEVAQAIELTSNLTSESANISNIHIGCTYLGIQISVSKIKSQAGLIQHYSLSSKQKVMTRPMATALAELILQLQHTSGFIELIERTPGVFHLLIHPLPRRSQGIDSC